jgi:hypothetical protein
LPSQPIADASAFGPPVAAHGYGGPELADAAADAVVAATVAAASATAAKSRNRAIVVIPVTFHAATRLLGDNRAGRDAA